MCRGNLWSPLLFIIEQNSFCKLVMRGAAPHAAYEVELLKSRQSASLKRRVRQTLLRRVYGSQKLAPSQVQWKMSVCTIPPPALAVN
jgi:hypothetical protein